MSTLYDRSIRKQLSVICEQKLSGPLEILAGALEVGSYVRSPLNCLADQC